MLYLHVTSSKERLSNYDLSLMNAQNAREWPTESNARNEKTLKSSLKALRFSSDHKDISHKIFDIFRQALLRRILNLHNGKKNHV